MSFEKVSWRPGEKLRARCFVTVLDTDGKERFSIILCSMLLNTYSDENCYFSNGGRRL